MSASFKNADPHWLSRAIFLVGATMAYNVAEAVVALWEGIRAGSIALTGFGFDSVIECVAAGALFWRLRVERAGASHEEIEETELRVRKIVGVTFIVLAFYVAAQAAWSLWSAHVSDESIVGIALAVASAIIMPVVAWGKIRAAREIGSRALEAEAKETIACSYLSWVLLLGLALNAWRGWWWADPVAALVMVPWLIKEGREGLAGEACGEDDCCD